MLAILNSLNVHNLPIFQPILMILVSKFMIYRALSDKTYLSLVLLSPLIKLIVARKPPKQWISQEPSFMHNRPSVSRRDCSQHQKTL